MRRLISALAAVMTSTLICACGGDANPDVPIDLQQAWANYFEITGPQDFTITGTVNGFSVTGSGVETRNAKTASSFEGIAGFEKIYDTTGTFSYTDQGQTFTESLDTSAAEYFDAAYAMLGRVTSDFYMVATSFNSDPIAAWVGDSGEIFTADVWDSAQKNVLYGTVTMTYEVLTDDSKTSVLVRLRMGTDSSLYRVKTTGEVSYVSATSESPEGVLTMTYH